MHSFARSFFMTFAIAIFVLSFSAPVLAQDAAFPTNTQPAPLMTAGEGVIQLLVDVPVAEEPVEEPAPDLLPPVDPVEAAETLVAALLSAINVLASALEGITGSFATIPVTVILVSLLKRIPFLEKVAAPTITFAVAVVLWCVAAVTGYFGVQVQFYNLLDVLGTALPGIVGLIATLLGAPKLFEALAKRNVAVIGYQRSRGVAGVPARAMPTPGIASASDTTIGGIRVPAATVQSEGTTISYVWTPDVSDEDRAAA